MAIKQPKQAALSAKKLHYSKTKILPTEQKEMFFQPVIYITAITQLLFC